MVLVHVERATFDDLDEAITDAWLSRAPRRLTRAFLAAAEQLPAREPPRSSPGS
jgi:hypothetical protein